MSPVNHAQHVSTNDASDAGSASSLTICVCTYRRPELSKTLKSIAEQRLPAGVSIAVVVVDNDTEPTRQADIESTFQELQLSARYVHAPERNISIARNACLDNVDTRWAVFIDDDEIAPESWIANLLAGHDNENCVFGVSRADYDGSGAPRWMIRGDFHSNFIGPRDGAANGYTCNTLLDMDFVREHQLRFREDLGQVGGEDTMFFRAMEAAGARFGFNPKAIVHEPVPPRRATLQWLINRQYRSGQNHFDVATQRGDNAMQILVVSGAKAALFFALGACTIFDRKTAAANYLRGMLHWGAARRAMGVDFLKEYG